MSTFGGRLRLLRAERGLYIYEMAEELHHASKTQLDYEHDVKMPSIERAMEIASYFGCPLGWLLGEGKTFAYESTTEDFIKVVNAGFQAMADQEGTSMWISVKDRLPEVGGYVVCIAKRNPFSRFMPMVARIEKNGWVNPITEQYISEVTHWMPIPDPPKEGTT